MNELDEGGLRLLMHGGGEAPDSRVDLVRVVTDGRRRRRWRAAVTSGAAAVAVLALAGAVALALPHGPQSAATGPGTTGQQGPPPAASDPGTAPAHRRGAGGFDPVLLLKIWPGWLPTGVTAGPDPSMWAARQSERYADKSGQTDFTITLYAPGFAPPHEPTVAFEPAEPLNNTTTQWYFDQAHPERSGLLWRWAPDAYATVEGVAPGSPAEDRALWRHVAENLATNARRPVPVPGYVTDVRPELLLLGVDRFFDPARHAWMTTLVLGERAYVPAPPGEPRPGLHVSLVEDPDRSVLWSLVGLDPGVYGKPYGEAHPAPDPRDWTIEPVR